LRQAINMFHTAWNDLTAATIPNCWRHTGFVKIPQEVMTEPLEVVEVSEGKPLIFLVAILLYAYNLCVPLL
jgi:hypothetical protein